MTEYEGHDPEIEAILRGLGRPPGSCPDPEELASYAQGVLPADASARIAAHILRCGSCELALSHDFSAVTVPAPVPSRTLLSRLVASHTPAYLVIALLLWPAYRGLTPGLPRPVAPTLQLGQPRAAPPANPPLQTVERLYLDTNREASTPKIIRLSAPGSFVVISFSVPAVADLEYTATIVDRKGGQVLNRAVLSKADAFGNFDLLCRLDQFGKGSYQLNVQETKAGKSTGNVYLFRFQAE